MATMIKYSAAIGLVALAISCGVKLTSSASSETVAVAQTSGVCKLGTVCR